jgi:hypothetical protein
MRRIVCQEFGPPDRLRLEEAPYPRPGPGEILVRVRAGGVSFIDGLVAAGRYQFKPPVPFTPGLAAAGGARRRGRCPRADGRMVFKLIEAASERWRYVKGPHLVALVRAGAKFEKECSSSGPTRPRPRSPRDQSGHAVHNS